MRRSDVVAGLVAALFVVGPLAHLAFHDRGHSHLPGGGVVVHGLGAGAHPHAHDGARPHTHGADAIDGADGTDGTHHSDGSDGSDAPGHGAGSLAHLSGAPTLVAPVLAPPPLIRLVRRPVARVEPRARSWRGRVAAHAWRSRAPPVRI